MCHVVDCVLPLCNRVNFPVLFRMVSGLLLGGVPYSS